MNRFTISQLQQFSGINVHTIRAWEKRYNALKPERSVGNTRYYNGDQLKRLLNICCLLQHGEKISEVAVLSNDEIKEKLRRSGNLSSLSFYESRLIQSALDFDERLFEQTFHEASLHSDLPSLYINIIYPLLIKTGLMWASNDLTSAQEHFLTNLIRQKLCVATAQLPAPGLQEKWVLFLPEGEFHEIGLLYASFVLKQSGRSVYYFGSNLADDVVKNVCETIKPDYALLFFVHQQEPSYLNNYLLNLTESLPAGRICVAASQRLLSTITAAEVNKMQSHDQLLNLIKQ